MIILPLQWNTEFSAEIHDCKGERDNMRDTHMGVYICVYLGSQYYLLYGYVLCKSYIWKPRTCQRGIS